VDPAKPLDTSVSGETNNVRVRLNIWVGCVGGLVANGGLDTAAGSIYADKGLKVSFKIIDWTEGSAALASNNVDIMLTTADVWGKDFGQFQDKGVNAHAFYMVDWSRGADGVIYTITGTTGAESAGTYRVTLTNGAGSVASSAAVLSLRPTGAGAPSFTAVGDLPGGAFGSSVRAATEDGQIADLVGGDFNCTPESPLCRELANSLGPSVQQLSDADSFVTWDGLSAKPGAGRTIDYIFIRERTPCQNLQARQHVAFTAARLEQRLSDHLGIEAEMNLSPASSLTGAVGPFLESSPLPSVAGRGVSYGGGD